MKQPLDKDSAMQRRGLTPAQYQHAIRYGSDLLGAIHTHPKTERNGPHDFQANQDRTIG